MGTVDIYRRVARGELTAAEAAKILNADFEARENRLRRLTVIVLGLSFGVAAAYCVMEVLK